MRPLRAVAATGPIRRGCQRVPVRRGQALNPYYDHAGITIYHGDCREMLRDVEATVVVTDPPYGISHSSSYGASWKNTTIQGDTDTAIRDEVLAQLALPAAVCGTWKTPPVQGARGCLVWDKGPQFGMGDLRFPWKPSFELVYITGDGWEGRRDEGVLRFDGHISWESLGRTHPHEKPVALFRTILQKAPAGIVLDPFAGSGASLVAAKDLGRKAIGIEIEERYCEIAAKRLAQEVLPR